MVHIAVLMMVKNEKKRLHVSLESIKGFADSLVIFDTGSEDNTIEIARTFCEANNIPFRLKEGTFVNFSVSRNESLDFAYTFDDIDYLLLMDVNDEIRGSNFLRMYANEYADNPSSGFLLCQEWFSGNTDKYYNVRFIKSRKEWYYNGVVHEYIKTRNEEYDKHPIVKFPDNAVLYQDRTQDDDKSGKRFTRDKELLMKEFEKDPTEPRTVFYLAQTCSCLNHNEDAYYYYKIRSELEGFQEEKFHAFLRCGELSQKLSHSWYDSYIWYLKAFEHSVRAEPLLFLAIYYINIKNWLLAFTYIKLACSIPYPEDAILFVNKHDYDYKRWHLLGIAAYYVGQFVDGKIGCLNAIQHCKSNPGNRINYETDEINLKFYEEKEIEKSNKDVINPKLQNEKNFLQNVSAAATPSTTTGGGGGNVVSEIKTKKQFIDSMTEQIRKDHPNLTPKQINTRANMLWKNRQKLK